MAKMGLTFRQRSWVTACWLHLRVCNNMMWKDIVRSRGDEPRLYIVTENRDEDRDTGAILVASIFKHHPWVWANLTSPPMASNTHTHTHPLLSAASFPLWCVSTLRSLMWRVTSRPVLSGQEDRGAAACGYSQSIYIWSPRWEVCSFFPISELLEVIRTLKCEELSPCIKLCTSGSWYVTRGEGVEISLSW